MAQGKHTKLDQLKKKMSSIEHAALQREKLLEHERHKNARLEATLAHLERHLEGRFLGLIFRQIDDRRGSASPVKTKEIRSMRVDFRQIWIEQAAGGSGH